MDAIKSSEGQEDLTANLRKPSIVQHETLLHNMSNIATGNQVAHFKRSSFQLQL